MSSLRTRALNDDSPLVVPEVRPEDFVTLPDQRKRRCPNPYCERGYVKITPIPYDPRRWCACWRCRGTGKAI